MGELQPLKTIIPEIPPTLLAKIKGNESHGTEHQESRTQEQNERLTRIMSCEFMAHCDRDRATLSEREWYMMISILCKVEGGYDQIHELSYGYPQYSQRETDAKIIHALRDTGPATCERIKELFNCGKRCNVKSPIVLARIEAQKQVVQPVEKLDFPRESIQGTARVFADLYCSYMESPWSFWAVCYLTCFGSLVADKVTLDSEIRPPPRLFAQIVGQSADDRKSTAIRYTVELFKDTFPNNFIPCYGVGSGEGLAELLEKNPKTLMVYDETKSFVDKGTLKGSVLIQCVNSLFEDNVYQINTKAHHIDIRNAHLSFLGASTLETYERMWGPNFRDIGFLNRLLLVPDTAQAKISIPKSIPFEDKLELRNILKDRADGYLKSPSITHLRVDPDAFKLFDDWYMNLKRTIFTKRVDTYGHRLMVLFCANEGKSTVDADMMDRIIKLLNWQIHVREANDPVDAEGQIARMEQNLRRVLKRQNPQTERQLKRNTHADRIGLWAFETALSNLKKAGEVFYDKMQKNWILAEIE